MTQAARRRATLDDLLAIPEGERQHELFDGEIVERAAPSASHGTSQVRVAGRVDAAYQRAAGGPGPGGWWIATEVETLLPSGDLVRPDVVGWRRDRHPTRPSERPVRALPDWICEIVSPERARDDTVRKLRLYERNGVGHYWIVDSRDDTLTVHRWMPEGYLVALRAERGERVRAEPFEAVELVVGELFGDDPTLTLHRQDTPFPGWPLQLLVS